MNTEAFVYCWTDWRDEKLYIGYHRGSPDDGYVCSSEHMLPEYKQRPDDFSRQIVASGSVEDMIEFERKLLKAERVATNEHYYNINEGGFNVDWEDPEFRQKHLDGVRSDSCREKRSEYMKHNNPMYNPEVAKRSGESISKTLQAKTEEEWSETKAKEWETRRKKYGATGGNGLTKEKAAEREKKNPGIFHRTALKVWETRRKNGTDKTASKAWETRRKKYGHSGRKK